MTAGSLKDHYYIGQHTTDDINDGYKGSGRIVKDYYKKHPLDYAKEILYFCNSKEELNKKEKELIEPHLGKDYCLNIAAGGTGGDTFSGRHHTEETKNKISASKKGVKNPMYGKHHTEETRAKMSAVVKASRTPEVRAKISAARKGIKFTKETCEKISASLKGHKLTDETKSKISDALKGDKHPGAKSTTIQNILTNEILTFGCTKDCAEYLQVNVEGVFRSKFLKGIPTPNHPILKNWRVI